MNYIISYAVLVTFLIACAVSHHRGYRTGRIDGRNDAETTATRRVRKDHFPIHWGRN